MTPVADHGMLDPGTYRVRTLADDEAVLSSLLEVEVAWAGVLAGTDSAPAALGDVVAAAAKALDLAPEQVAAAAEAGGNPVIPVVRALRAQVEAVNAEAAPWVHRGLTSQDVLDTALMLVAARVVDWLLTDLATAADALASLADRHRDTPMVARTLTQHALPTTFGLKAAGWLEGLLDAREQLAAVRAGLPVQCGGAAGTLALAELVTSGSPDAAADALADRLGLVWPGSPWHTRRGPVTRLGDGLVAGTDAVGKIATDIALLCRPELGELAEPAAEGRGGSSTMPQKRNPVLSVLMRSAALQAPPLAASLHASAAAAVDERPDGAWHAEWPVFRRLLLLAAGSGALAAELLGGIEVRADAMAANLEAAGPLLLAERLQAELPARLGGGAGARAAVTGLLAQAGAARDPRAVLRDGIPLDALPDAELDALLDPRGYLGATDHLIDHALARAARLAAGPAAAPRTREDRP